MGALERLQELIRKLNLAEQLLREVFANVKDPKPTTPDDNGFDVRVTVGMLRRAMELTK